MHASVTSSARGPLRHAEETEQEEEMAKGWIEERETEHGKEKVSRGGIHRSDSGEKERRCD